MTSTALVTGAAGFVGSHLVRRLADDGLRVVGAGRRPEAPGHRLGAYARIDVRDAAGLESFIRAERPERIFHLAGVARGDPREVFETNALGTLALLEAAWRAAPEARVLLVGSAAEYGEPAALPLTEAHPCRPRNVYGIAKYAATLLGLARAQAGQFVVVARPFNIVGGGVPEGQLVGDVIARALRAMREGASSVLTGNLDTERDYVAVEDVVEAYARMLDDGRAGKIYNLCSGRPVPTRQVVDTLLSFAERPLAVEVDPELARLGDVRVAYGSAAAASGAFGFAARVPLETALRRAWEQALVAAPSRR